MKTLIIFAHTFWEASSTNKILLKSTKNMQSLLKPLYYTFAYVGCISVEYYAIFNANRGNIDINAYHKAIKKG